jgi:hypothetical protein
MATFEYLDFEVAVSSAEAGQFAVTVLRSPAGEARGLLAWPWSTAQSAGLLADFSLAAAGVGSAAESSAAQAFGAELFQRLFAGEVGYCYQASKATTRMQGKGLRLKLRIEPPALLSIPWELLYDPHHAEFIALSRQTPLVRYLAVLQPIPPLTAGGPLQILGMAASPAELPPLDLAAEQARLAEALAPLHHQGKAELVWASGPRWRDLHGAAQSGQWRVIHFIGHAGYDAEAGEGVLLLEDDARRLRPLRAMELARLLDDQPRLRLVVLNACEGTRGDDEQAFSSLATALVRRGLPAVVAMQFPMTDATAVEFSRSFYSALAAGLPIDTAISGARQALSVSQPQTLAWAAPVLYLRAADGRLWLPAEPAQAMQPTAPPPPPKRTAQVNAQLHIGGNVTGSTIVIGGNAPGAGSGSAGLAAQELQAIEQQMDQLQFALRTLRGQIGTHKLQLAEVQLRVVQSELLSVGSGQPANGGVLIGAGEWLLANTPELREPLARFFQTMLGQKLLAVSGAELASWVRNRLRE